MLFAYSLQSSLPYTCPVCSTPHEIPSVTSIHGYGSIDLTQEPTILTLLKDFEVNKASESLIALGTESTHEILCESCKRELLEVTEQLKELLQ